MGTIFRHFTLEEMRAKSRAVVVQLMQLPRRPSPHAQWPSPIGMTVPDYLHIINTGDKPTHVCGCGWKGTASGDAGACPACGGVPTPQT